MHFVFAGGGTAGHLFPGLAVAAELATRRPAPRITFVGSGKPFEKSLVAKAGFTHLPLPCAPFSKGVRGMWKFLGENLSGYRAARKFLREEQVNLVVGLGGYASVPMCRAALAADVPLVLLEQNALPGKATRWLASRADLICTAFDEARSHLESAGPIRTTGNPIREGFRKRFRPRKERSQSAAWQRRLVVLGGSGGAQSLNEFVPKALYKLRDRLDGWQIVHQTGLRNAETTQELYRKLAIEAVVAPFIQNLPQVLRRTDLAVCRAGGTTLAELAATAVPAILIPYPHAADNHQRKNAEVFTQVDAARLVDEREIDSRLDDAIVAALDDLLIDTAQRKTMAMAMRLLARPEAAWRVAAMVFELACQSTSRKVA